MASPKKPMFTKDQENQLTELYLGGKHKNPEISQMMGFTRATLNYAIAFFALSAKFKQKYGTCKTQHMVAQTNKSTDNPECHHTGEKAIRHWYIDKGLTAHAVAIKLGLKLSTVKYKIRLYGLNNQKIPTYTSKKSIKDFTLVNKKFQQNVKSNFNDAKKEREKTRHLLESDLSTLDITKLTPTTCRGINTNDSKDTFCLAQIEPSQTYCQHHMSIYYTKQKA